MRPRERFLIACNHRKADRIPISLGGTANKMYESTMRSLLDYYGIPQDDLIFEPAGFKYVPFSERLYRELGVDMRMVYAQTNAKEMLEAQQHSGTFVTKWGNKIIYSDSDAEWAQIGVQPPFADKDADAALLKDFNWPKPEPGMFDDLREKAIRASQDGEYAVGLYRLFECGIFGTCHNMLRGTEEFFCDLMVEEEFAEALMDKVLDVQKEFYGAAIDCIRDYLDFVEYEDDMGMQDRTLVSADVYRNLIKPRQKELIAFIKQKCKPDTKVFMHSDGAIFDFIPDFIEMGVDILNPLQVGAAGIDLVRIKREFGDQLTFCGGLDVLHPYTGGVEDVKQAIRSAVDGLAAGGGYILAPTHNYSPNIALENIITTFDYAREYGRY